MSNNIQLQHYPDLSNLIAGGSALVGCGENSQATAAVALSSRERERANLVNWYIIFVRSTNNVAKMINWAIIMNMTYFEQEGEPASMKERSLSRNRHVERPAMGSILNTMCVSIDVMQLVHSKFLAILPGSQIGK